MQDEPPARTVSAAPVELIEPADRDDAAGTDLVWVWRLLAPWLGYLLLGAAALFGLFSASEAADTAEYQAGMVTFALALGLIALRMKRQLDGHYDGLLLPLAVTDEDGFQLYLAVLGVLAVGGLVLAASTENVFHEVGIALFLICVALVFWNVKRYFDRREEAAGRRG